MATGTELKLISRARLKSAKILYRAGDYDCAMYILGYSIECALKASICKHLNLSVYPDRNSKHIQIFKSHDFDRLLTLTGLAEEVDNSKNTDLYKNWSKLTEWNPENRYLPVGKYSKLDIELMINALVDKPNGFLNFLTRRRKW